MSPVCFQRTFSILGRRFSILDCSATTLLGVTVFLPSLAFAQTAPAPTTPAQPAPAEPAKPATTQPAQAPAPAPKAADTAPAPESGEAEETVDGEPTAEEPPPEADVAEAAPEPTPDPAPETTPPPDTEDDDRSWDELHPDDQVEKVERVPRYTAFVLADFTAKYGVYSVVVDGTFEADDAETNNLRTGQLGGQATVGVMPGGSAFAMAGRLRGGSYVGQGVPGAYVAAEMFFGANFARNEQGSSFAYVMGGIGVEFLPSDNQDMLTLSATGGTVINGIDFGGTINIAANDEVAIALIGMQIGWGRLF